MTIVSPNFVAFVAVVLVLYYIVPKAIQWVVLLLASVIFYMLAGVPWTFTYLAATILTTFFGTTFIAKTDENDKRRKMVFIAVLVINLGFLALLKYMNFFLYNANLVAGVFGKSLPVSSVQWLAALGISFYTLQMVGYLTDVYWGVAKVQTNLFKLSLFACYFPQMVTGPISRYNQVESQLFAEHKIDFHKMFYASARIMWGVGKKLSVAERIAPFTTAVFSNPEQHTGVWVWAGMFAYLFQLYCDFSGSIDIIIGISECFGIKLPENFRFPFVSRSIKEFWKRWHITLGMWLQDYLMYPILRSKLWILWGRKLKKSGHKKLAKTLPAYTAMMILWTAVGMWHGNGWRYIFQGFWFGAMIILGQVLSPFFKKVNKSIKINEQNMFWRLFQNLRTIVIFAVGMIFFKAPDLQTSFIMLKSAFVSFTHSLAELFAEFAFSESAIRATLKSVLYDFGADDAVLFFNNSVCILVFSMVMFFVYILKIRGIDIRDWTLEKNIVVRWCVYYAFILLVIITAKYGSGYNPADFIYGGF